jgi:lipoprotein-anchoring transpeptidase ErfK/SrfK
VQYQQLRQRRVGGFAAHSSRLTILVAFLLFTATWTGTAPANSLTATAIKPTQRLVALRTAHAAFLEPGQEATRIELFRANRPLTGVRTVLPVIGDGTAAHRGWMLVRLPGRPNGRTGWIKRVATVELTTKWHIVVKTSSRRVIVYRNGRAVRTDKAIVGTASTPTPHGTFFVEEVIKLRARDAGAPFALALSARSNVLQEFNGGPGQIGVHGLKNVGGVLGTAVSHGCIRLANATMRWLVLRIGPGVPVTITR